MVDTNSAPPDPRNILIEFAQRILEDDAETHKHISNICEIVHWIGGVDRSEIEVLFLVDSEVDAILNDADKTLGADVISLGQEEVLHEIISTSRQQIHEACGLIIRYCVQSGTD